MRLSYIILLAALLLCAACRPRTEFCNYQPVSTEGWESTDTLRFEFTPLTAGNAYLASLGLRFTDMMPYQDLWLVLERRIVQRRDTLARRDTLHLPLGSDSGHWQVQGNVLHETDIPVDTFSLSDEQPVTFLVYHIMSRQSLPGITEVGLKVERIPQIRY